jgi:5'-nucleotidase (lipoprotein e(P4) family)
MRILLGLAGLLLAGPLMAQEKAPEPQAAGNALVQAVAWKQTAAEYRALYHQGYNIARMRVEAALAGRKLGDKPLAVLTDVDDTVLLPLAYWGYLVAENRDFYDDAIWDRWVPDNGMTLAPGAAAFFAFCAEKGVEVFYVTSRNQGEGTLGLALGNLRAAGLPYVDEAHVTVLRDSSDKEPRQAEVMASHEVVVLLGDNLNDFRRAYYIKGDVDGRIAAMEADSEAFGRRFVLFPNPTDGHWLAAIFSDSEPPPSSENREILRAAATRQRWTPAP